MAGKEPLRILSFVLCALSFALLCVAIYTDHWKETQISNTFSSIHARNNFEGIWNNCWSETTGQTHCYPQPYNQKTREKTLSLPTRFYFYRGLTIVGLLANFIGLIFIMTGLKCIDISFKRKVKMQLGVAFNGVTAVCVLATFILFKVNEWQNVKNPSSLGKGMYLAMACVVCEVAVVVLAIAGMESDDADYVDENESFQPKGFQPGSIVNQAGHGASSYI